MASLTALPSGICRFQTEFAMSPVAILCGSIAKGGRSFACPQNLPMSGAPANPTLRKGREGRGTRWHEGPWDHVVRQTLYSRTVRSNLLRAVPTTPSSAVASRTRLDGSGVTAVTVEIGSSEPWKFSPGIK